MCYRTRIAASSEGSVLKYRKAEEDGALLILVVDDDSAVRRITRAALEGAGYEVLEAENGNTALRELREHTPMPQILLTDIVMPGMTGLALAAQVHRLLPGIRVIFMSGFMEDYRVELTGSVCLQKPFTIAQLLATVRGAETAC